MNHQILKRTAAVCFVLLAFAVSTSAQISIKDLKIGGKKPDPKHPPTTTNTGNKTPPSVNTNAGGSGATREEVNSFMKDLQQFVRDRMKTGPKGSGKGLYLLKNMAADAASNSPKGCGSEASHLRTALDDGAAFAEIVLPKYPKIENPTWTRDEEQMVGDWRRAAENRVEIVKTCVTTKFAVNLRSVTEGLEQSLAKIKADPKTADGFILSKNFDDPAAARAVLVDRYKDEFALVGVTMPDASVFAQHDAALKAIVDEAKKNVGLWNYPWTYHNPMIEGKARGFFAKWDPKGTIVKINTKYGDWQVDSVNGSIPKGRYNGGYILFRRPGVQHCLVVAFAYEQNYMGGGKYNEMAVTSGMTHALRLQNCK
ncbi:MAG: hypothetical protein ACXWID_05410 [Pyrinomonadaceae bacterium]